MENKTKIFIVISLLILIISALIIFNVTLDKKVNVETGNKYFGPVPQCYDEEYFRETGKTQKLSNYEECMQKIKS